MSLTPMPKTKARAVQNDEGNGTGKPSPVYLYLCSLVANYSNEELSNEDRKLIKQYNAVETYLLYEI